MKDNYKYISALYKELMKEIDYREWSQYLYDLIIEYFDYQPTVLELGAGNGILANYLQKKMLNKIIKLDLSKEMLLQNKKKDHLICGDMRYLPVKKQFDVVFSAFDSMNYILTEQDFMKVLFGVKNILTEEGIFTFDVSLEKNSILNEQFLNRSGEFKNIKYQQISNYNREEKIHYNKFIIEIDNKETVTELHKQKVYDLEFYTRTAKDAGFYIMEALDAFSFEDVSEHSERAQFVLKIDKE